MARSPNFGERRDGLRPELIVIHYTGMESCAAAYERLCDPDAEVSAHYLIDYDGTVLTLVPEELRAWHAGAGEWQGRGDVNSRSIGIELANSGAEPFPEPQMAALETLLSDIMARWQIGPLGVIAHSDMAPGRKRDPGRRFDWRRLALRELSVWPMPASPEVPELSLFRSFAGRIGYSPDASDDLLLEAFRLRFRPWATGPMEAVDVQLAQSVALLSVDREKPSA